MYNPYAEGTKITLGLDLFAEGYSEKELSEAFYDLTADPEQELLLLESASFQEIDDHYNPGLEMILEAIRIKKFSQTDSKMRALVRILNKNTKNNISVEAPIIGKPRKSGLFATVTVQIPFSDGQILSIVFHSPGGDERKILSEDAIIAFRWLLNKRDVTHVVSPEKGRDVSLEKVAKRVMQIVAKNSEAFQKKQTQIKAQKVELEETVQTVSAQETKKQEMMGSIADLEEKADTLDEDIDILKARVEKIKQENADLETQLESLQKRKAEQKGQNDQADEIARLQKLGAEKVPGVRLGDTEAAGKLWEMLQKGKIPQEEWDKYVEDLYSSGHAQRPEPTPREESVEDDGNTTSKEPWERTKEEWISAKAKELHDQAELKNNASLQSRANSDSFKREAGFTHEKAIQKALSENKPVPPEVLADYPDLAEQQSSKNTKLDKIQASIVIGDQPDDAPSGSIIFNALRPIYGHNEWQGDFAHGRFYAAVDPDKDRADWMIEENRTLDAWILEYIPREEFIARAQAYFRNAFPKLADKAEEKYSDDQFIESYKNYIGKKVNTYSEVRTELAKPVGKDVKQEPKKKEIPILPSKQQKGNPAKRAAKILHSLKLEEKAVKDGFHIKLKNGEYQDLSIETHDSEYIDKVDGSRRIYLTQYIKEGGDLIIDSEMVFLVNAYTGYLKLVEIGHQGLLGEVRKTSIGRPENSWANIFSKNLIDQGYDKAGPAEEDSSGDKTDLNPKFKDIPLSELRDRYEEASSRDEQDELRLEIMNRVAAGETDKEPVGEEGYNTWYDTEADADAAMQSMLANGLKPENVGKAFHSESNDFKYKIYRSQEELDRLNAEFQAKQDKIQAEEDAKEAAKKAEYENAQGFTDDLTPIQKANVLKVLNKQTRVSGEVKTQKKMIEDLVDAGATIDTREENKIKPMSRTAFNRATQAEQDAHEMRIKNGGKKAAYTIADPGGDGSWYDITKTEYDFANYLIGKKATNNGSTDTGSDLDEETLQVAENFLDGMYDDMPMDEVSDLIEPVFDLDEDKHMDLMEKVDSYATELTKKKAQAI